MEEARDIGTHDRADTKMAERGEFGAVEVELGVAFTVDGFRDLERHLTHSSANFVSFGPEARSGTVFLPPFSRASKASAVARTCSAFTASGLPSLIRRGVPSRRKRNT